MPKRSILLLSTLFVLIAIVACSNNEDELQSEIDDLNAQLTQAKAAASSSGTGGGPSQAELDSVKAELAMAKEDLANAKYKAPNPSSRRCGGNFREQWKNWPP